MRIKTMKLIPTILFFITIVSGCNDDNKVLNSSDDEEYNIDIVFDPSVKEEDKDLWRTQINFVARYIHTGLPDYEGIDDLQVTIKYVRQDQGSGVIDGAGVSNGGVEIKSLRYRPPSEGGLPYKGTIQANDPIIDSLSPAHKAYFIIHEVFHILAFNPTILHSIGRKKVNDMYFFDDQTLTEEYPHVFWIQVVKFLKYPLCLWIHGIHMDLTGNTLN